MTFARPDLLMLVPAGIAVIVLFVLLQWSRGRKLAAAYGGRESARRLLGRDLTRMPLLRLLAGALAVAALVLAATDPQPEEAEEPPPPTPIDLVVMVDVSHSMSAIDVGVRRIDRARELIEHIVEERAADRIGLSIFADWPYTLVPLTDDTEVITFFGPWLSPELVGTRDQGTSVGIALGQARAIWEARAREDARRIVLMISDAEVHDGTSELLDSVAAISDAGFEVWTAGVGTPEGAQLFVPGSQDAPLLYDGAPVIAGYDEGLLREIAESGRGSFYDVSGEGGARDLVAAMVRDRPIADASGATSWRPAFWLLLAAFMLLLVEAAADFGRLGAGRRPKSGAPDAMPPNDAASRRLGPDGKRSSVRQGTPARRVA